MNPETALADINSINSWVEYVTKFGQNMVNPEIFYSKILLDTIRYKAEDYKYYRIADEVPIENQADKLSMRRWAPLQAHTEPLEEGIPPISDKSSVEKYEITAYQYGRYMEFTDKVDFRVVDPVVAHYSHEYSLVALETLDLLARQTLLSVANQYFAEGVIDFEALTVDSRPNMIDLRMIVLALRKSLVKGRTGDKYEVIGGPEFFFDMIDDETVKAYMTINLNTGIMYSESMLVDMFNMYFVEALLAPTSGEFIKDSKKALRIFSVDASDPLNPIYSYATIDEDTTLASGDKVLKYVSGYVADGRTGAEASFIPNRAYWDLDAYNADPMAGGVVWAEFKVQHVLVIGKDALKRTGLKGQGSAQFFTKPLGSSGVLDPINQRQSIGFKINSVGFGSMRLEAIVDYLCVPSTLNLG